MNNLHTKESGARAASFDGNFARLVAFDFEESSFEDAIDDEEYVQQFCDALGVERDFRA